LTGLFLPIRPNVTSATIIGRAIITIQRIYTMTNAPPPFSPAIYGNFQIFPKPTADPAAAKINVQRLDHDA